MACRRYVATTTLAVHPGTDQEYEQDVRLHLDVSPGQNPHLDPMDPSRSDGEIVLVKVERDEGGHWFACPEKPRPGVYSDDAAVYALAEEHATDNEYDLMAEACAHFADRDAAAREDAAEARAELKRMEGQP